MVSYATVVFFGWLSQPVDDAGLAVVSPESDAEAAVVEEPAEVVADADVEVALALLAPLPHPDAARMTSAVAVAVVRAKALMLAT